MDIPYRMIENDKFSVFYKPAFWKMDTDAKYNLTNFTIPKLLDMKVKPLHVYIGLLLKNKNKNHKFTNLSSYDVCHRYDLHTTGMIIVASNSNYFNTLRSAICDKKNTRKIYVTLVNGIMKVKSGYINKNIVKELKQGRRQKYCICKTSTTHGLCACSYYKVVSEYVDTNGNEYSLVQVKIFTGRTHQIRVHLASLGHSVISDYKYCSEDILKRNLNISRLFLLHNIYLSFKVNDKRFSYQCNIPYMFQSILQKLKCTNIIENYQNISQDMITMKMENADAN